MSPTRWLVAATRRPAWQWLETVLLTLLAAALAYATHPADPLLLARDFPWLLFAPVLLALRYGVLPGLGSTAILAALWVLERAAGLVPPEPPTLYFAGALLLTLVCGEFAGLWEARVGRCETSLRYVREKLDRLTRQHYLLLTSHQRLEQDQLVRPVTLRAALGRIRRLAAERSGAAALAALLAQVCQLEAAGLYACEGGEPQVRPIASIGPAQALDTADPMVRHCLEHRAISHVQVDDFGQRYVLVAPVASSDGRLLALLAVEQMSFLALQEETLSTLGVLLGYYADALQVSRAARVMRTALPSCPLEFADELVRMHRMRVAQQVPSTLLLLRFGGHPDSAAFAAFIRRQMRDLDMIWDLPPAGGAEGRFDMLLLLPLAGEAAAADAIDRLEGALEARYQVGFDAARIRPYSAAVEEGDPFVALKLFLDLHDVRV